MNARLPNEEGSSQSLVLMRNSRLWRTGFQQRCHARRGCHDVLAGIPVKSPWCRLFPPLGQQAIGSAIDASLKPYSCCQNARPALNRNADPGCYTSPAIRFRFRRLIFFTKVQRNVDQTLASIIIITQCASSGRRVTPCAEKWW